jgi:MoxR-like ATPase
MNAYFEYLAQMLRDFFKDLGEFFRKGIISPWSDVGNNFSKYHSNFAEHVGGFGFLGWFFFILFLLFFIALVGAIIFGLFILIRKYVRFVRREIDKDELRRQVERLNYELYTATQEKDKILNLKTAYMGLKPASEEDAQTLTELSSRFPKLVTVDSAYSGRDTRIMPKEDLSLEELCNSFRNFAASKLGLYYTIDIVREVFAGMATSKLIILEGISGTGKTSLAYALGKFFSFDSAIIPVQPSWKDRSELLGYYNEFTKKFNETEFLKALYVATYRKDLDVVVLDEMNLARIEYYFAEFLSVMEMRDKDQWVIDLIPTADKNDPKNLVEGKLLIPQNIIFFGTANNDDSTFTISDKVYDRAISLFFEDKGRPFEAEAQEPISIPYSQLENLYTEAKKQFTISEQMLEKFEDLDNFVIRKFKLAFGNRIMKQLESFVPTYVACGGSETDAFDFIFTNKILKKFESLNIAFLKEELEELHNYLDKLFGKGKFPKAQEFIKTLLKNN